MKNIRVAVVLLVLATAHAACRKSAPPASDPAAIGRELATFRQVLMPLSPQFVELIGRSGVERAVPSDVPVPYMLGEIPVNGRLSPVFAAYTDPWKAPKGLAMRPMSIDQFLSSFAFDMRADIALVRAPKGDIHFTRGQLPEVLAAAHAAGAAVENLPLSVINGAATNPAP